MRRHANHIRRQDSTSSPTILDLPEEVDDLEDIPNNTILSPVEDTEEITPPSTSNVEGATPNVPPNPEVPIISEASSASMLPPATAVIKSYPKRHVRPPDRYKPGQ